MLALFRSVDDAQKQGRVCALIEFLLAIASMVFLVHGLGQQGIGRSLGIEADPILFPAIPSYVISGVLFAVSVVYASKRQNKNA